MKHSILAIEVCLRLESGDHLRDELRRLVLAHPEASSPGYKADLLRRATGALVEHQERFAMGCWDFFDDDARALKDYDMWCNGMITEEGARTEPSGAPREGQDRFMTFTVALLLVQGADGERRLKELCETPDELTWRKETFLKILRGLDGVDYTAVKSDVLYLIPGDGSWGLTREDLQQVKFEYLREIRD
jgi:hypothetical protein